ncbi:ABC-2 type transport system permease protein [Dysgonomonas sp. PFB1-18]|uniref:ABC transporter permease n=1 Tax=unclassified Dysgonomonas TaxID=2630389 RepID=UPI0024736B6D|nr:MULTISPECIES: ABC transporter permease [unclassified Dysgonomonas]MDH6310820.1 ABC-2 type transport system permease protein [Dysgonomonas sp. PF1-14]MDH6340670.1 ABC-2 type transport system permease protein [Dysgonomonas sp. PF1-16]MDH6382223.1 ABC-2 type transport system permease protein [Dysgonomonas sp. PFB1-18]MDH6399640.1 ABC-2 type transport system permease protein [Dysgonomonas sp. PF1-23]
MTGILAIFKREWLRISTSKICIWGLFVTPLLSLIILMWMMSSGLPSRIPIAVVDLDNSTTSRSLVRQLDAFEKTDVKYKSLSFKEAREMMQRMEVYAVLTIPKDFAKDAVSGNRPKLVYYTNNAFLISGSLLFQDLKTVSTLASAAVGLQTAEAKGFTANQVMPILQPITIDSHPIGNPWLNYSVYLNNVILPGILQLIILMFTVSAFGSEIKSGTGSKLLAMGNNSIAKVVIGKLLPYTILYAIMALLFMSILYYYNHFPLHSGFWPMFFNYLCLILAAQGAGVMLLGIFRNYRFALSIASLIGMVSFSITGFSFSTLAMDGSLSALSNFFPLRHFFLIYVDQALNGIPFGYSMYQYAALLCFVLLSIFFWGVLKRLLKENIYEL